MRVPDAAGDAPEANAATIERARRRASFVVQSSKPDKRRPALPLDVRQVLEAARRARRCDRLLCLLDRQPAGRGVLCNGGISFGGVLAFIFADLIVPILDIYRRYYNWRMAGFLLASFYVTMAAAGLIVEFVFQGPSLTRGRHDAKVEEASVHWNYTTVLNIVFLLFAAMLLWRYFRQGGGVATLRMMNRPEAEPAYGAHAHGS